MGSSNPPFLKADRMRKTSSGLSSANKIFFKSPTTRPAAFSLRIKMHRAASSRKLERKSTFERHRIDCSSPTLLFGNRNQAALDLQPRHFPQGTPAQLARGFPKLACSQIGANQIGDILVQQEEFINRHAATMALLAALDTSLPFPRQIGRASCRE